MYSIPLTLYDCLVMFVLTALFVIQVIFTCAFERKPPVNRNYKKPQKPELQLQQRIKLLSADGQLPQDVVLAKEQNDAAAKPRAPPPVSVCPEDTLHNVTSLQPDNETSMYFLSTSCSKTCLPSSYVSNHSLRTNTAIPTPVLLDGTTNVEPVQ
uniref:Neur_chan_memb domain-containing protein n=1 Tax=Panagrellus redivivus TaxID=6233 RepID=A0A7E4UZS5_PANRE